MNETTGPATCFWRRPSKPAPQKLSLPRPLIICSPSARFRKFAALAVFLLGLAGTTPLAQSISPLYAVPELGLHSLPPANSELAKAFDDRLPAKVRDGRVEHLLSLSNCREYLEKRKNIVGSDSEADYQVLRYQTVPCEAIALLMNARSAERSALPRNFSQMLETKDYPATLWAAVSDDDLQRTLRPAATLETFVHKPKWKLMHGGVLQAEGANMGVRLTLLARGDFNHDGWEDAALRWEGYALKGSYTATRLVILTRTERNARLRELAVDPLLPTN